ncbi:MAG: response regulator [Deltaproteobacteria bacterium]|uniref:Response regulator n=1 Tax=Candidatus Zymogenus saltonus TaxID=2844893 RepID=A0A9D8KGT5_9DELT|nr:response regulator [Candidatus Zymogenus saltonus]
MSEKLNVLIVDDDRRMVKTLTDILKVKGFDADSAYSGLEAVEKARNTRFDCILTDIKMPGMSGVELFKAIKNFQPEIPMVMMTAYSTDRLVEEGLEEGAIAALVKPLDLDNLLGFFSALRKKQSIVIIDDDPKFCKTLGDILRKKGFTVRKFTDPASFIEESKIEGQVVLLDMKLKGVTGLDVLREIKTKFPDIPVILVTGYREEMLESIESGLKMSAFAYLYKPFEIDDLLNVLNEVRRSGLAAVLGRFYSKKR